MASLLVVEDDPDVSEVITSFLNGGEHDVRVAADGEDGLRPLDERIPDLLLLDVEMPVLSGPAMAYRMFMDNVGREKVPIIFLSGVPDLRGIAAHVGTAYYLSKPFSRDQLLGIVAQALKERQPPKFPRGESERS